MIASLCLPLKLALVWRELAITERLTVMTVAPCGARGLMRLREHRKQVTQVVLPGSIA
jgi:hypothetical protein